jgi:hypothetical protein
VRHKSGAYGERAKRYASVKHGDDSMGWFGAYLPSHDLAATEDGYRKAARRRLPAATSGVRFAAPVGALMN